MSNSAENLQDSSQKKQSLKQRMQKMKTMGKRGFWLWIIYQTIKGTLTTTFIWVPMIYYYFTQ